MTTDRPPRRSHWEEVYGRTAVESRSWFQAEPLASLRMLEAADTDPTTRLLDVGGGTSRLVDHLLEAGHHRVGILDISEAAIAQSRERLGERAIEVEWFAADVTRFISPHEWDVWHDRATFHFLTEPADRTAYRDVLLRSLAPGGHVIMATFSPTGPERCSGLPTVRYSAASLGQELGADFALREAMAETHATPGGSQQDFLYCLFKRLSRPY